MRAKVLSAIAAPLLVLVLVGTADAQQARTSVNQGASGNTIVNPNTDLINNNMNVNRNYNMHRDVDVNSNVNRAYYGGYYGGYYGPGWGGGCCYSPAPVATAAAVTTATDATPAAIGTRVYALPGGCGTVVVGAITYSQCGETWYQPQFVGAAVSYVVVAAPR